MKLSIFLILIMLLTSCGKWAIEPSEVDENTFIDNTEVTVGHWIVMMTDLYHNDDMGFTYLDQMPIEEETYPGTFELYNVFVGARETPKFKKRSIDYNLLFQKKYNFPDYEYIPKFSIADHGYLGLPVTGISKQQADNYCLWRTKRLNELYPNKTHLVRLIQPLEFDQYSRLYNYLNDELRINNLKKESFDSELEIDSFSIDDTYLLNCKTNSTAESANFGFPKGVIPVALFYPAFRRVYDWFGNVSEMTAVEGIAKGGSYMDYASDISKLKDIPYDGPEKWLGFRTILEIEKR